MALGVSSKMLSPEQLHAVQEYASQKMATVSQKSLEQSAIFFVNNVSPRVPERLRLPFHCMAYFVLFHLYLFVVLVLSAGLFLRHQYASRLGPRLHQLFWFDPARQKAALWLLIVYHAVLSAILMPSLEECAVSEEELADGWQETLEKAESAEEEEKEKTPAPTTEDMFQDLERSFHAEMEAIDRELATIDEAFLLDPESDLTLRE